MQVDNVHPGLDDVIFVVLTVVQSIFSLHVIVTLLSMATPVAPFAGAVEIIRGAVLSMVTELPADGASILPAESVALLWIVYGPSAGRVQE